MHRTSPPVEGVSSGRSAIDTWRAHSLPKDIHRLQALRIAVVYGPLSTEDAVYMEAIPPDQWSAASIEEALGQLGIITRRLDPCGARFIEQVQACDVVFLNVHGPFGEDGRIQGLLDFLGVPYTCSSVLASSIGMDKLVTKTIFSQLDVPTPASVPILPGGPHDNLPIAYPAMLKSVDGGSSIGIELVSSPEALQASISRLTARGFSRLFIEEFVPGRIVTSSAIHVPERGVTVLPPLEAVPPSAYYDEATKLGSVCDYKLLDGDEVRVADVLRTHTERIFAFLECRGAIRVDFILDELQIPWALEINTIPGLQRDSNLPVAARLAGIEYADILVLLLADALHRHHPRAG